MVCAINLLMVKPRRHDTILYRDKGGGGGGGGGPIRQEATCDAVPRRHDTVLYAPRHGALCVTTRRCAHG